MNSMDVRQLHIPNARLEEGKVYPFLILKTISLEPGDRWLVLQDPNGYKILLPEKYYTEYGFKPGQKIRCRVDKINCNGRMFLEPMHPFYKEGEVYVFPVAGKGKQKNILGQDEWFFVVADIFGKKWIVRTFSEDLWQKPPEIIRCKLKRIKKGRLFLIIQGEEIKHPDLKTGKTYSFVIMDERIHPVNGNAYFILADSKGNKHLLKKKYYHPYGLKKGQEVQCRVDKFASEGYFFLEPLHPCYQRGKTYEFSVDRMEEMVFTDGFRQKVLVLNDCFGQEVKIHMDQETARKHIDHSVVRARVKGIRKSRLELDIRDQGTIGN